MGWLLSLLGGQVGKIALKLLPYILGVLLILSAYLYGHHQATVSCHSKELQAVIDAQNIKLTEMQKQYEDAQRVINSLSASNKQIQDATKDASDKIAALPNPAGCEIHKEIIDLINQARTGDSGAKK